jgi:predicted nucleic acid-binding protein
LRVHVSAPVVLEYKEVLLRETVPQLYRQEEIIEFLDDFVARSIRHSRIPSRRPLSPDPDDDAFIELVLTANVRAFITHNTRHFKLLREMGCNVLTPAIFLKSYTG